VKTVEDLADEALRLGVLLARFVGVVALRDRGWSKNARPL
jgi:hypothetical protein